MGPVAIALIGAGVVLVWSGVQGVNALDVVKAVLTGSEVPRGEKAKAVAETRTKAPKAAATDTSEADELAAKKAAKKEAATDAMTEAMRS